MHHAALLLVALGTLSGSAIAAPASVNARDAGSDVDIYQLNSALNATDPESYVQARGFVVTGEHGISKRGGDKNKHTTAPKAKDARPGMKHKNTDQEQEDKKKKKGEDKDDKKDDKGKKKEKEGSPVELGSGENTAGDKLVEIDCAHDDWWEGCNTICAASICLSHTKATGLWITEGSRPIKMDELVHNKQGVSAVHVPGAHDKGAQEVKNRILSGCERQPPTTSDGKEAMKEGIMKPDPRIPHAKSGDEWPPNASKSGGAGALVQIIAADANSGVGRKFVGNMNGHAKLINIHKSKADVCQKIIEDDAERSASKKKFCNGADHRFVQFEWKPEGGKPTSSSGEWHEVGKLPAKYLTELKHGS